jgi:hypothetical protein
MLEILLSLAEKDPGIPAMSVSVMSVGAGIPSLFLTAVSILASGKLITTAADISPTIPANITKATNSVHTQPIRSCPNIFCSLFFTGSDLNFEKITWLLFPLLTRADQIALPQELPPDCARILIITQPV